MIVTQQNSIVGAQNVRKVSEVITSEKFIMPTAAYEQSSRKSRLWSFLKRPRKCLKETS